MIPAAAAGGRGQAPADEPEDDPPGARAVVVRRHDAVRALIDDPLTPPAVRACLMAWTPDQQTRADRIMAHLLTVCRELSEREGIAPRVFDEQVVPTLHRAAVLLVSARLDTADQVAEALWASHLRDEHLLDPTARSGRGVTIMVLCTLAFSLVHVVQTVTTPRETLQDFLRQSPASHWRDCSALRAAAITLADSTADRLLEGRLLPARAALTHPLAAVLARRRGIDASGERELRSVIRTGMQVAGRVVLLPALAATLGPITNMARWWGDLALWLVLEWASAEFPEIDVATRRLSVGDYSLLLLSQPDLARRVGALSVLSTMESPPDSPSWLTLLGERLRDLPRPSTIAQALVLWASFYAETQLLSQQPWPVGEVLPNGERPSLWRHLNSDTRDGFDCLLLGALSVGIGTVGTYAALTVRAHAPAIDAGAAAVGDRLRRWILNVAGQTRAATDTPRAEATPPDPRSAPPSADSPPARPYGTPGRSRASLTAASTASSTSPRERRAMQATGAIALPASRRSSPSRVDEASTSSSTSTAERRARPSPPSATDTADDAAPDDAARRPRLHRHRRPDRGGDP